MSKFQALIVDPSNPNAGRRIDIEALDVDAALDVAYREREQGESVAWVGPTEEAT